MRLAGSLALALALSACGPSDSPQAQPTRAAAPGSSSSWAANTLAPAVAARASLALDAEGLRLVAPDTGRTTLLAFGAERGQVEQAVQRAIGISPDRFTGEECPAGPTQFARFGELQLAFQDDRWIGWALNGEDKHTTLDGIGIGTTRREAEASRAVTAIPESTLGDEFVLASPEQETAIGGMFSGPGGDARIEYLWAGVACNFR